MHAGEVGLDHAGLDLAASEQPALVAAPCGVPSIARRGDLKGLADRLDTVDGTVLVDEPVQHFNRRSSAAWANIVLASVRMLARRSSLTSRSSSAAALRSCFATRAGQIAVML